ncbi:hypothetical protein SEA_COLUCCI_57 [Arthrobacter phage Colucci]|uniref:Uncharacterized protein n=1 Tax=Arthrobacter phage Colucci TaxID=2015834 RepID=A0A286N328_9CAUD|nr:hypothetical protein FDI27_gp057 [Arthrobacter phage Colucci]ASX98785.1 hypothetical protein SEA_COLUCCI_57 [Arthrobacter phage Colucci]
MPVILLILDLTLAVTGFMANREKQRNRRK